MSHTAEHPSTTFLRTDCCVPSRSLWVGDLFAHLPRERTKQNILLGFCTFSEFPIHQTSSLLDDFNQTKAGKHRICDSLFSIAITRLSEFGWGCASMEWSTFFLCLWNSSLCSEKVSCHAANSGCCKHLSTRVLCTWYAKVVGILIQALRRCECATRNWSLKNNSSANNTLNGSWFDRTVCSVTPRKIYMFPKNLTNVKRFLSSSKASFLGSFLWENWGPPETLFRNYEANHIVPLIIPCYC